MAMVEARDCLQCDSISQYCQVGQWPYLWLQTSSYSNSPARQWLYSQHSQHSTPTMGADKAGAKKSMGQANAEFKKGNYAAALKHYDKEGWDLRLYQYYHISFYYIMSVKTLTTWPGYGAGPRRGDLPGQQSKCPPQDEVMAGGGEWLNSCTQN